MDPCFYEILAGKSRLLPENGEVFFYRHPTLFELEMSCEFRERYTLRAKKGGMLTEQQMLFAAKSNGGWSNEEEAETTELKWLAEKQKKALKKVADEPSLVNTFQDNLNTTINRLEELDIKRMALTRFSLENYVEEKVNMELFRRFVFDDEECKEPTDQAAVMAMMPTFMDKYEDLMDQEQTLRRCYNPSFFEMFLISSGEPLAIFGKNIYEITIFQKNLLVYSFILRRKIDNIPDIPASVIDNPIALYSFDPNKPQEKEEMNIREFVQSRGGEENLKPEDYAT